MKTLLTMLLLAAPAQATDVVVFPAKLVNLEPGEGAPIGEVLAAAFTKQKVGAVMGPTDSAEVFDKNSGSRSSSSRLYLDLQVAQNLIAVDTEFDFFDETDSGQEFYPTEVGLMFGIGW